MLEAERAGAKALVVFMDDFPRNGEDLEGAAQDPGRRGAQLRADRRISGKGRHPVQPRHRRVLRQGDRGEGARKRALSIWYAGWQWAVKRFEAGTTQAGQAIPGSFHPHARFAPAQHRRLRKAGASAVKFAAPRVELEKRADGSMLLRSPQKLRALRALRHRVAGAVVGQGAGARVPRRAQRRRLAQADLPRDLRRGAAHRARRCSTRPRRRQAGRDPLGQQHRPRAARARRDARRHSGRADLAGVFADVEGLRQAEVHLRAAASPGSCSPPMPQKFGPALEAVGAKSAPVAELLETNPGSTLEREHAQGAARHGGEDPLHLGLDRHAEGRDQHARACCARTSSSSRRPGRSSRSGRRWWSTGCRGTTPSAATTTSTWCCATAARCTSTAASRCPGLVETTVTNLERDLADHVLQRAARLRPAAALPREGRGAAPQLLPRPRRAVLRRGGAAAEPVGPPRGARAKEKRDALAMLSAWGSTETSPLATSVHFPMERAGRDRPAGRRVASSSWCRTPASSRCACAGRTSRPATTSAPDLTEAAFDEEGFYRIGDAVKLADPADPARGIVFDGRVAEDFKLSTGTWVHVGAVRVRLIAAADPLIQDAVDHRPRPRRGRRARVPQPGRQGHVVPTCARASRAC